MNCCLALQLRLESSISHGPAFLLKPRRKNTVSRLALCPLSSFMAAFVSSRLHHRINFLIKIHLSLAFSFLQLPLGNNYQAIFSLPGAQTN